MSDYQRRASALLLAVAVRSATLAVRKPLQQGQRNSEERWTQIKRHLSDWRTSRNAFFHLAQHRITTDVRATISTQATVDTERRRLMAAARDAKERLDHQAMVTAQHAHQGHPDSTQPLDLIVTRDALGQIVEAFEAPLSSTDPSYAVKERPYA